MHSGFAKNKANKQDGWTKCEICGNEFRFEGNCFETDTGDLCPTCTAEMVAEQK